MITFLTGILCEKDLSIATIDVNGVGYQVFIPLSSYEKLPEVNNHCKLLIYHHISDSDQKLFGFVSNEEREMFTKLLNVNGVGPKLAICVLSGLPLKILQNAILSSDISVISSISGVGKKTAERIILDMKGTLNQFSINENSNKSGANLADLKLRDATLALIALGHNNDAASKMVKSVASSITSDMSVEEIIRQSLKK